ncbi:MAG: LPS export ABC transporter periplasmic protein LptC [Pseudomonadota bacterium]|nr:LPS export ABC transporter periplasmic protein LptC [Pseudomonadota bacterium]
MLTPLGQTINASADAQRLQRSVGKWRRRSYLISSFRRLLPLVMIAVVGVLGWFIFRQAAPTAPAQDARQLPIRMVNPTFRGQDDGRPFVLSAREATRDGRDYQRIALLAPTMTLQNKPGEPPTRVTAERGVYREDTLVLTLEGDVRYSDAVGWRFLTKNAVVDTKRNLITGDQGVEGDGPTGHVKADSYSIYNQGERVTFRGNVSTLAGAK